MFPLFEISNFVLTAHAPPPAHRSMFISISAKVPAKVVIYIEEPTATRVLWQILRQSIIRVKADQRVKKLLLLLFFFLIYTLGFWFYNKNNTNMSLVYGCYFVLFNAICWWVRLICGFRLLATTTVFCLWTSCARSGLEKVGNAWHLITTPTWRAWLMNMFARRHTCADGCV